MLLQCVIHLLYNRHVNNNSKTDIHHAPHSCNCCKLCNTDYMDEHSRWQMTNALCSYCRSSSCYIYCICVSCIVLLLPGAYPSKACVIEFRLLVCEHVYVRHWVIMQAYFKINKEKLFLCFLLNLNDMIGTTNQRIAEILIYSDECETVSLCIMSLFAAILWSWMGWFPHLHQ